MPAIRVVGDNDRSIATLLRVSCSSRLTAPPRVFGPPSSARTISNFICVPRNAGTRNSIRRSRTKNSLALHEIGPWRGWMGEGERYVSYYACVPRGWSKTDLRRSEGRNSTAGNELHIRPLREQIPWASSEKAERKSKVRGSVLTSSIYAIQCSAYMEIRCNIVWNWINIQLDNMYIFIKYKYISIYVFSHITIGERIESSIFCHSFPTVIETYCDLYIFWGIFIHFIYYSKSSKV